jgi:hypothetical protein
MNPSSAQGSFFKQHIRPALLILLIPAFSAWFFRYAEKSLDRDVLASVEQQIAAEGGATPEQKEKSLAFFRAAPVSQIMALNSAEPGVAEIQATFEPVRTRYAIFVG